MQKGICYDCGKEKADSREHVIARCLISPPLPGNLITVLACTDCNNSYSADEEYLRDRLSGVVGGANFEAPKIWDVAWRSMKRPQAKWKKLGFFKDVLKLPSAVQTKDGLSDMALQMNKGRVNRVIHKMVRGFYFHRTQQRLTEVECQFDLLSAVNPTGDRKRLLDLLEKISKCPTWAQEFGPDTSVTYKVTDDNDRASMWAFKLFGQHIAIAVVVPKS